MGKLLKNLTFKAKDPHKAFCKISIIITTKLLLKVYAVLKRYNYNFFQYTKFKAHKKLKDSKLYEQSL